MTRRVVLNTRPREQAATLTRLLEAAGFEVVEAPAIAVVAAWDAAELASVERDLAAAGFEWVILPSHNAGRALLEPLRALGTRAPHTRLVTGAATAHALGLTPEFALERFSAEAALEVLRPLVRPGDRALVPRAAEGRDELLDGLRDLAVRVSAPLAYRTVAVDDAVNRLRAGGIDAVTLCSPSSVASLLRVSETPALAKWAVVCLGETTAAAARAAGLRVDAVAEGTNMASLVKAVQTLSAPEVVA